MATPTRSRTKRDRAVGTFVRRQLYPHTVAGRERVDAAEISHTRVRSIADLAGIEPVGLADAGDGSAYLVQPSRVDLMRHGSPYMRLRTLWASTWGRWHRFLEVIEPHYRPVHYFTADGVPIGAAAADLIRLANLGSQWMRSLGVAGHDSVALVGGAGSGIEAWELSGGTRRAGVSVAVLDDATSAKRLGVSVLAGPPLAIVEALSDDAWPELRLIVVFGRNAELIDRRVNALGLADHVAVRRAWAPAGTRAVWFECRGGPVDGWHTSGSAELIEVDESNEALWTGIGWAGTVFLRLRTDLAVLDLDDRKCEACGHDGPRVFIGPGSPALGRWLAADDRVADLRLTDHGAEILPVRAGANARLVSDARKAFPEASVTVKTKRGWST